MPNNNGTVAMIPIFEAMNFLAHYFFDRRDEALFNVGLIYPDLYRNFVIGARINRDTLKKITMPSPILQGCQKHYLSDDAFHYSPPFKRGELEIKKLLRQKGAPSFSRDFFIAHIFYELVLDHYLLISHPGLAEDFYRDFRAAELGEIELFTAQFGHQRVSDFMQGFRQFIQTAYLFNYSKPDSVVYALGRICNKMNISPFNEDQKTYLNDILNKVLFIIAEDFTELQLCLQDE